tara:strand:+ start:1374 stop:1709 length:336 start_codon:yes stop_codon:yes gene_type:complete
MGNSKIFFNSYPIKIFLLVTCLNFSIYGCYTVRFFHDTDKLREIHDNEIYGVSSHFTINQKKEIAQIRTACPSGASLVEIEQSILDGLANYLSLGFYSKQTIKVWCKRRER